MSCTRRSTASVPGSLWGLVHIHVIPVWEVSELLAVCRETTSLNLAKLRGVTFVNQYVVIKYLGKGANGRVFLCLDMCDNRLYAVKVGPHDACS